MNLLNKKAVDLLILCFVTCISLSEALANTQKKIDNRCVFNLMMQFDEDTIRPLKVGDFVPDILFENTINFPAGLKKMSDLKGKLVILDFWSTWCSGCIGLMPHMEALQKKFSKDLVILVMNPLQTEEEINKGIEGLKHTYPEFRISTLPGVNGDKRWYALFPYKSVPYHVWIDKEGKVISCTHGYYNANENNIARVLKGEKVNMIQALEIPEQDYNHVLIPCVPAIPQPLYYSVILPYANGILFNAQDVDSIKKTLTIRFANTHIEDLYKEAYPQFRQRIIFSIPNAEQYYNNSTELSDEKFLNYHYTYELSIPLEKKDEWRACMAVDLNRFFEAYKHFKAVPAKVTIECYVLQLRDKKLLNAKRDTSDFPGIVAKTPAGYTYTGAKVSMITDAVEWQLDKHDGKPLIVLNETGLTDQRINFTLPLKFKDIVILNDSLTKAGFQLVSARRNADVLMIKSVK